MQRAMNSPNSLVKCLSSRERERPKPRNTDGVCCDYIWVVVSCHRPFKTTHSWTEVQNKVLGICKGALDTHMALLAISINVLSYSLARAFALFRP